MLESSKKNGQEAKRFEQSIQDSLVLKLSIERIAERLK